MTKTATKSAKKSPKLIDEVHRVYWLPEPLRDAVKQSRADTGLTVKDWLAETLTKQLPQLVEELRSIGIGQNPGKTRPARLPLSDSLVALLQNASAETGLPQSLLLLTALGRQSASAKPAKRTRKPRAAKA